MCAYVRIGRLRKLGAVVRCLAGLVVAAVVCHPSAAAAAPAVGGAAIAVEAGSGHTCALLADGSAECWGLNSDGQLGDGSTANSNVPVRAKGITDAVAIGGSAMSTCVVVSGGSVECWGDNSVGELGDATTTTSNVPVAVNGITNAVAIGGGGGFTCAVLSSGGIDCWGDNETGDLGDGTTNNSHAPVPVQGITTAVAITSGGGPTVCALLSGGGVDCWGADGAGQLGNGVLPVIDPSDDPPGPMSDVPVAVVAMTKAVAVAAGYSHACAGLSSGNVACWGLNSEGELGAGFISSNSTFPGSIVPVAAVGITDAVALAGGGGHTCALRAGGGVDCWGDNSYGQLGNGTEWNNSALPTAVTRLTDATTITAGEAHTCAVRAHGGIDCWGLNNLGQLGNGSRNDARVPVPVVGIGRPPVGGWSGNPPTSGLPISGAGGGSQPTGPTGGGVGSKSTGCPVYTRRSGRREWRYTIRIHRKLSCSASRSLIRRVDAATSRVDPDPGVYIRVSPWVCREFRPVRSRIIGDCRQQGRRRLRWTETQFHVSRLR
jgi:alpha-tubulin suppressor-like RCC1 family protein